MPHQDKDDDDAITCAELAEWLTNELIWDPEKQARDQLAENEEHGHL